MKPFITKLLHSLSSAFIVISATNFAHADDTEVFFGAPSGNGVIKNVLFILDDSGSMSREEETDVTGVEYDPNGDYDGDNDDDKVGVFKGDLLIGYISLSQTSCQTLRDRLSSSGEYIGAQLAAYNTGKRKKQWQALSFGRRDDTEHRTTECADDRGVHGKDASSTDKYAVAGKKNSSPWTSSEKDELAWNNFEVYTLRSAHYLNWYDNYRGGTIKMSRIDIMKNVITRIINSASGMNVGLMSFNNKSNGTQGGRVTTPLGYIEDIRQDFLDDLDLLSPGGYTPLSETLFEALRYYEGGSIFQGADESHDDAKDPSDKSKYKSPIASECQPNKIILLTDGQPYFDANINDSRSDYDDNPDSYKTNDIWTRSVIEDKVGKCEDNCLDEVAKYMNENDLSSSYGSSTHDLQNVQTYTIGFYSQQDLLKKTAAEGGGQYYEANNTTELELAVTEIFSTFKSANTTFVSPGVTVNTFNRLNHRDELYFSVFSPEKNPQWSGNLKRYRIGSDGVIYDSNGRSAIDPDTGYFRANESSFNKNGARSWWSAEADGDDVPLGGAAENLPDSVENRNVFTFMGSSKDLTEETNLLLPTNTAITSSLLGAPSATDAERIELINWVRGMDTIDVDDDGDLTDTHKQILDPLHSSPSIVIYGGTDQDPDTTVFYGDNQGFLHAVNGSSSSKMNLSQGPGEEYFAFMPKELLENQAELYNNSQGTAHPYGLDGTITIWRNDENNDLDLYDASDFAYLYTGMRRGGNSYYALDVTDRAKPKFLWQIKGGSDGSRGFEELGQTWSKPVKTKIKMGKNLRDVLIFGGGYDTNQDSNATRDTDSIGRAVYIVDAKTGDKIWSATPSNYSDMKYSIPSNVKAIDVNNDNAADQIYVGDMGGQVWRFDIDNENSSTNSLSVYGGTIANLSGNDAASNRRFYHAPDVSVQHYNEPQGFGSGNHGSPYLAIAIASGWHAHPLNKDIKDRLFMLQSKDVRSRPLDEKGNTNYFTFTEEHLYDASANHLGDINSLNTKAEQEAAYTDFYGDGEDIAPKKGWFIEFPNEGEKSLSSTLTINGKLYYSTYQPKTFASGCSLASGLSRTYGVFIQNASPISDSVNKNFSTDSSGDSISDGERTWHDRIVGDKPWSETMSPIGEPADRKIDGVRLICFGYNCDEAEEQPTVDRTYWVEVE